MTSDDREFVLTHSATEVTQLIEDLRGRVDKLADGLTAAMVDIQQMLMTPPTEEARAAFRQAILDYGRILVDAEEPEQPDP